MLLYILFNILFYFIILNILVCSIFSWCLSELGKSLFLFVFLASSSYPFSTFCLLSFIIVPLFYLSFLLFAQQEKWTASVFLAVTIGLLKMVLIWSLQLSPNPIQFAQPWRKSFCVTQTDLACEQRTFIDWFWPQPCQRACGDSGGWKDRQ